MAKHLPETDAWIKIKFRLTPMTIHGAITKENEEKYLTQILDDYLGPLDSLCFKEANFPEDFTKEDQEKQFELMMKVRAVLWAKEVLKTRSV